ncbi:hypothetical protein D8674_017133 [Pyrus ussuriensis x Pyrus communis]|uniref:Agglutinin domain-containing protein n=1 Tax=Pyrus ussuriensis x Pyrus communis TaxID=2448454 RepID=A0A5N5HFT6_9ROSA|nr:hypothetical protein D8674_017133 [Pyrus ussuriensis x Pyrus communis]
MAPELPRYVVLQSRYNAKYLSYVREDVQIHGFLKFSGQEVVRPYAKLQVEMAKSSGASKGLVHIRCCYNNKYWVRWSQTHHWIVAGADEPQEDESKWSCTLFEPVYVDEHDPAQGVRLRHVQLRNYACLWRTGPPYESCLFAGSETPDNDLCDVCLIVDWESLATTGSTSAQWIEGYPYLQFSSDDIGDPTVGNEVFQTGDGSIRIKSYRHGTFWRRKQHGHVVLPVKVDGKFLALRNLGNNLFCKRLTTEKKYHCLNAAVPTITQEARLELEEVVVSRSIYNVNYRVLDARVYNQTVVTMATGEALNRTKEQNTVEMKLSYKNTRSSVWNTNVSLKLGIKTTFEAGVPLIGNGKIEESAEFGAVFQWGETETSGSVVETVYKVTVPPMTMVKVSLLATRGACDVPFSYTQRDTLTNGKQNIYNMDDGVYTGVNYYNFQYDSSTGILEK